MTASAGVWRNWARTESVRPRRVERPTSVGAVQRAVLAAGRAGLTIKAVGAGHSFTGIAVAPDVQLDLSDLSADGHSALIDVDRDRLQVRLLAGTYLHRIPALLARYGLAMANLGDIDRQTIAGAISTGTHGTGGQWGGLATQVVALTLVTADGSLITISTTENAGLLPAARLGLGALGIIVDVTLQCVPTFLLHAVETVEPLDAALDSYLEQSAGKDHYEFYWFPHTTSALTKTYTRVPASTPHAPLRRLSRFIDDEVMANGAYRALCAVGVMAPPLVPRFSRLAERFSARREYTDASTRVFVAHRRVRFREMEYALPRAAIPDALREVRATIERKRWNISLPLKVGSAAADDVWLSTAHGRASGYIAVHRYHREDPSDYFRAVEAIMREHDGRPHWGKLHFQSAASLGELYPHFGDFLAVRNQLDPERRFTNAYLERVLGP